MTTATARAGSGLAETLEPLIKGEISSIAAIDTALPRQSAPDYIVMFQDTKGGKQANVEQMAALLRMDGLVPAGYGGGRKLLTKAQLAVTSRVSTTATLRAMRLAEVDLVHLYTEAVSAVDGVAARALSKTLGRALIHAHLLTAHLAKRTGSQAEARRLPLPLPDYFAGSQPRACLRCHLDRPGAARPLERANPHPYQYLCAGCHDDVLTEFSPDLASQMDRWPQDVQEATVMQHGGGRPSKLNAINRILLPLAGLAPEIPIPGAAKAVGPARATSTLRPGPEERPGVLTATAGSGAEADYVDQLFHPHRVWTAW